jgi:Uncharacterised nucleotidyltransferase
MMTPPALDLLQCLSAPESVASWHLGQWDAAIRLGRSGGLLGRMAAGFQKAGVWGALPAAPKRHLLAATVVADRQHVELGYEVRALAHALKAAGVPLVLLKGSAYTMAGLAAGRGRTVSDVDILVPKGQLAAVETALMMGGWVSTNTDAYDQRYYRTWMHEIPPMRHLNRGTVVDLHHAVLPPTSALRPDTSLLLQAAVWVDAEAGVQVLAPADMVLHSATHLFHEGEFDMGMRGLSDLALLMGELSAKNPVFWPQLEARSAQLDLQWPLLYALRYCRLLLNLPVPEGLEDRLIASQKGRLMGLRLWLLDLLLLRALVPKHPLVEGPLTPLVRWLLYLRGHLLRMPVHLLVPHLVRKGFASLSAKKTEAVV